MFVSDLVEQHSNQFHISQINVLKKILVGGHRGEIYKCSCARKQSRQQIASCLLNLQRKIGGVLFYIKRDKFLLMEAERIHLLFQNLSASTAQRAEGNQRCLNSAALMLP